MRAFERKFSWRSVVLIAIAFALIGLSVLFRSGGSQPVTVNRVPSVPPSPDLRPMLGALGFGVLLVVSVGLGAWFGYLHLLRRSQNRPRREHESKSHEKT
jgi:hypothetical protein